ncbi:MAG: RNA polymerase sigma factor, partial [Planctomycetota bacterium]
MGDDFHTTRWSVVLAAGSRETAESREALAALCETYWFPLYAYARRRTGSRDRAEDLTQGFFAELLEKGW